MPKYKVLSPIKVGKKIERTGEVEMSAGDAADALARGELELVKEAKAKDPKKDSAKGGEKQDPPKDPATTGGAK
ncbi:hypothetical protein ACFONC_11665 [Luteimonas soli]|uniref:Uncharacterized protein n=1 Tax=Luteimonas soli TaxID=1648966 RepID=A0ABV7XLY0_9GAMM